MKITHNGSFLNKSFHIILDITIQLDISVIPQLDISVIPQVTTIICYHMKKNIIKKENKERKYKKHGGTRLELIC